MASEQETGERSGRAPEVKRAPGQDKVIVISVNERDVNLEEREQSGLEIKTAAIAQGVPIQLDFVLSIVRGQGKTAVVGDTDFIKIHPNEKFVAVADDDNS